MIQLGMAAFPKTANPEHMKNNARVDFRILDEDMVVFKQIQKIENYGEIL